MYTYPKAIIISTIFISLLIISWHTVPTKQSPKLKVVCTTTFLADALQNIAGNQIELTSLMHPGIDPHLYKASEHDVHALSNADLIIYHGLHLEGKMASLFKAMNRYTPTVAACDILTVNDLRTTNVDGIYDPHVWFDISLWIKIVDHLAQTLALHDPNNKTLYLENAQTYCPKLTALHRELTTQLEAIPEHHRILITAHDAFGYFGHAYNFTVIGLQGVSTDSDISIAQVNRLAEYIADHNIPVIFAEMSIPHKSVIALQQAVARHGKQIKLGAELYTDSLSDMQSPASTYEKLMHYTIDTILKGIICR